MWRLGRKVSLDRARINKVLSEVFFFLRERILKKKPKNSSGIGK